MSAPREGQWRRGLDVLNAGKTAKAPVLMAEAWIRTPSIEKIGMSRPNHEAGRSPAADSPCLGSGNTTKNWSTACIEHLSAAVETGHARCLLQLVAMC